MILQKALGGSEAGFRLVTFIVKTNLSPTPYGSASETRSMSCWALATGGTSDVLVGSLSSVTPGRMHGLGPRGGGEMHVGGIGQAPELSVTVLPEIPDAPFTSWET